MKQKVILILLLTCVTAHAAGIEPGTPSARPIVVTERGPVRGIVEQNIRMFLGIPYAAPPLGRLRWRPPEDHMDWFAPLNATRWGHHCPQAASVFGTESTTEDCLFLNVFAPNDNAGRETAARRYPVMVWIHGGALTVGESDDYIPAKLVQHGVIVVTINYRLGALGFLAHPALSAESPHHVSGNYGIMDQQFALKWVRRNIAAFGGDPQNVTIFGESGGGRSVFLQVASPLAKGLFHHGIVESGAYFGLSAPTLADEESHGEAFAASIGCSRQTARCLRAKSVRRIIENWGIFDSSANVDGKVLPQSPDTALVTGHFNHVPLMNGTNHDEWRFFTDTITAEEYPSVVEGMVGPDAAPLVLAEYPLDNFASPSLAVGAIGTDSIFACPSRAVNQILSAQVPIFTYEFNDINAPEVFLPPVSFPYGATHASELLYLFKLTWQGQLDAQQERLSDLMVHYWTQFAKAGDPNSPRTPQWPQYDPNVDEVQSLVAPSALGEFEFAADHKCDFWTGLSGAAARRGRRASK